MEFKFDDYSAREVAQLLGVTSWTIRTVALRVLIRRGDHVR